MTHEIKIRLSNGKVMMKRLMLPHADEETLIAAFQEMIPDMVKELKNDDEV